MNSFSSLLSNLSSILDKTFIILRYPRKPVRSKLSFLKYADESLKMYFITIYRKRKYCWVVYDSTYFIYAFYDENLPENGKIKVWGRVYRKKWLYIEKWEHIDHKKLCYEYFR